MCVSIHVRIYHRLSTTGCQHKCQNMENVPGEVLQRLQRSLTSVRNQSRLTFDDVWWYLFFYLIRVFHSNSPNLSVTWNYTIKTIGVEIAVNIYVLYCVLNWCWKRLQKCTKDFRAYRNLTPQKSFFDNLDSQQIDQMNRQKSFVE